jgi:diguanylate cyclase (GGDEF)-like protein
MKLFVSDAEWSRLQAVSRGDDPEWLFECAWHQRQRDPLGSQQLVDRLACLSPEGVALPDWWARLQLLRAELHLTGGRLDAAAAELEQARQAFEARTDHAALADVALLQAALDSEHGLNDQALASFEQAAMQARLVGDRLRAETIDAMRAVMDIYAATAAAEARWDGFIENCLAGEEVSLRALALEYRAGKALLQGRLKPCVEDYAEAMRAYHASGQIRRAVLAACNLAGALSSVNDHGGALDWLSDALALARSLGSPRAIGTCLMQIAHTLLELGQPDSATEHILDAVRTLEHLPPNRSHAILLQVWGDTLLASGDPQAALEKYKAQHEFAVMRCGLLHQVIALRGQVEALGALGRPQDALDVAQSALSLVRLQGNALVESEILEAVAELYERHPLAGTEPSSHPTPALHYMQLALDCVDRPEAPPPRSRLLRRLAQLQANQGDHRKAYQNAQRADQLRDREHGEATTQRALNLEVRHRLAQARVQSEHHAELARSEAARAELLAHTGDTLLRLGTVGQEITAQLDESAVYAALDCHVRGLLAVDAFAILLIDATGQRLELTHCTEDGVEVASGGDFAIALDDAESSAARSARECRELHVTRDGGDAPGGRQLPGSMVTHSALYAPMRTGGKLLGVMTLQSRSARVYGEREQLILRNLCAYGAIALDNARVHGQLREAQAEQLLQNRALQMANAKLALASATDPLTGLRNRRSVVLQLQSDVALSLRQYERARPDVPHDADITFMVIDLDHFKKINDRHGHAAGDAVLAALGERLRQVCRETDYLARWGGEEFLVVARHSHPGTAADLAERLRLAVGSRPFDTPAGALDVTASIGFASFPFDPCDPRSMTWEQVIDLADQAMYRAKRAGRDTWRGLVPAAHDNKGMAGSDAEPHLELGPH